MPLFKRYEGELVKEKSAELGIMPFIMPTRNESLVFFDQLIEFAPLRAYLDRVNAGKEKKLSLFHVALTGMIRAMGLRPKMNRFIAGNLLYQRKWIDISFIVKKELNDDSAASAVKVRFDKDDTLSDVVAKIDHAIERGRSKKHTTTESDVSLALKLPRVCLRALIEFVKLLDYFNLLPKKLIDSIELYSSIFVANLGSLGVAAPFHHLYNFGTVPIFSVIGQASKMAVVNENGQLEAREILPFRWTFDERIIDGFYCTRSLDIFKYFLLNPHLLETKPDGIPDIPGFAK